MVVRLDSSKGIIAEPLVLNDETSIQIKSIPKLDLSQRHFPSLVCRWNVCMGLSDSFGAYHALSTAIDFVPKEEFSRIISEKNNFMGVHAKGRTKPSVEPSDHEGPVC